MTARVVALIVAAGAGERLGADAPKGFVTVGGRPMLAMAAERAAACPEVDALVIAVPPGWEARAGSVLRVDKPVRVATGGETRQASVRAALSAADDAGFVLVHDSARPFASPALFSAVLAGLADAEGADGAVPVVPVPDTVKRVEDGLVTGTVPRDSLALAQTPQAFRAEVFRAAHDRAAEEHQSFTDDAALVEWAGGRVVAVPGDPANFKVTTAEDLARAEALAERVGG